MANEGDGNDDDAVLDDERRNVLLGISRWWCCSSSSLILPTAVAPAAIAASPSEADADARIAKALPSRHRRLHDENIATASGIRGIRDPRLRDYRHPSLPDWKGTSLPGPLSLSQAHHLLLARSDDGGGTALPMAKYPDPILRIPSSPVPLSAFRRRSHWRRLRSIAEALKRTAREEGAVGLAAQQCGIDASLIFIDGAVSAAGTGKGVAKRSSRNDERRDDEGGIFLVNPRIVQRSPESKMKVWTEECLVLPPGFRAALLRDAEIVVEYESLGRWDSEGGRGDDAPGTTRRIALSGEFARCAQHEMDHDRGVLIVDHVPLGELLWRDDRDGGTDVVTFVADVENSDGLHDERMRRAYERYVAEPSSMFGSARDFGRDNGSYGGSNSDSDSDDDDGNVNDSDSESESDIDSESDSDSDGDIGKNSKRNSDNNTANPTTRKTNKPPFVSSANAMVDNEAPIAPTVQSHLPPEESTTTTTTTTSTSDDCDVACLAERNETIRRRRAMMKQSRSDTNRGDVLELSRQRALLYGSEFRGLSPGYCSGGGANGGGGFGGFCP